MARHRNRNVPHAQIISSAFIFLEQWMSGLSEARRGGLRRARD